MDLASNVYLGNKINIFARPNDLASKAEIESVSQELFNLAPVNNSSNSSNANSPKVNSLTSKLASIQTSTQSAQSDKSDSGLSKTNFDKFQKIFNNNSIRVFGPEANANFETVKMMAANQSSYNVNISDKAAQDIACLKAMSMKFQTTGITEKMDGKVNVSQLKIVDYTNISSGTTNSSSALDKDKKGSSFSIYNGGKRNSQNNENSLNLLV